MSNNRCRLTELHENELSHILSRLPTKDAVRTSILSRDWRYKWNSSYTVDIEGYDLRDTTSFVNFVNRILIFLQHYTRFHLKSEIRDLNHIQAWLKIALTRNLESLDLSFQVGNIVLPSALLNSTCLRELKLCLRGNLNVSVDNFAPNLTSLDIHAVDIVNNHTRTTLKFTFPLLKKFSATRYTWSNVTSVEIDAPVLTTFISWPVYSDSNYKFVILSPRVATFSCHICLWEKYIIMNKSSIVSAHLHCADELGIGVSDIGLRLRKMVNEFTNLQALGLSGGLREVLPLAYPLQRHDKLRKLNFQSPVNSFELLLELLNKAPSLKGLRLNVDQWVDYDYGAIGSLPSCIVSQLEEVQMLNFTCETPQYNLVKFLSMNGEKLKKLIMVDVARDKENEVEEYVSALGITGLVLEFKPYAFGMYL